MKSLSRALALVAALVWSFADSHEAVAQSILRDAETEKFLRAITDPILEAAELTPESVQIILIHDKSMNAFVAGGQNIFIHSGLIMQVDDVNQLLGVLAHEAGHITGGHLVRFSDGLRAPTAISILSLVLGAAAVAAGAPDAGIGILAGGQQAAQRKFFSYSRIQEAAADQAGAQFLERAGLSGEGLVEVFHKFREQEFLLGVTQDPYVRTHPLTSDRLARLEQVVGSSPYYGKPPDSAHQHWFRLIQAKLGGYVNYPRVTLQQFPVTDRSLYARYARVYAYHKAIEWDLALAEVDSLIAEDPEYPYFHEIKGQILFENGRVAEAVDPFRRAVELAPREPLILTALGQALVAQEDPEMDQEARRHLELATALDRFNSFGWYQLAIVYTRAGEDGLASLATAERFSMARRYGAAAMHAKKALDALEQGTSQWIRAQDILLVAEANIPEEERRRRRARPDTR